MATVAFAPQPASAQDDEYGRSVGFRTFYDRLEPYGQWFESDRWGYVWQPEDVGADFRPYYDGHWVYTDRYGWYWVSDEDWGDIVYHYGRWVYDPDDGWLWIPGYVWAPAWVIWREGAGSTGWFPMPPDDDFYDGDESWRSDWSRYADDDYYGYSDWYGPAFGATFFSLWVFVDDDHFGDRHFHRYIHRDRDDRDDRDFFRRTRDATRYTAVDNYIVNRGVDPDALRRRTGQSFAPVRLRDVLRRDAPPPTPVDLGHRIQRREIETRPNLMPNWFRQGEPLKAPRLPTRTGPQNLPQNLPPKTPRFPGARTPDGAPVTPPDATRNPRNWRDRFQRTTPPPVTPGGVTPNGGAQPDNVFMPHNVPVAPVANPPAPPQSPKFERRDWRPDQPATNPPATNVPVNPLTPPEPRRFERFQPPPDNAPANLPARRFERVQPPPDNTPANLPARNFERFQPPPSPPPAVTRTLPPPPPSPAVTRTLPPPPPATKTPPEERGPRDHPRREPQD